MNRNLEALETSLKEAKRLRNKLLSLQLMKKYKRIEATSIESEKYFMNFTDAHSEYG